MDLTLEIEKSNIGIRISILGMLCARHFFGPDLPKMGLGFEIEKTYVGIRISILEIPCVLIFSLNGQLWTFWCKFGEISNYVIYCGSNNIEGVAEKWVDGWNELDGGG